MNPNSQPAPAPQPPNSPAPVPTPQGAAPQPQPGQSYAPAPAPAPTPVPSQQQKPQLQRPPQLPPQGQQMPQLQRPPQGYIPQPQQPQQFGPPQPGQQPMAQQPPSNPNSTQNSLEIAEIRDGLVIMNDGSYRSVIMAQSINFDLMSPEEREAVEFSYQSFLNSLYFDIQISIRSQKVDLRPYIQKLEKLHNEQDNMLLAYLMDDYINYIQLLAQETNIMDKRFYIVVPYFPVSTQAAVDAGKGIVSKLFGGSSAPKGKITIHEADLEAAKTELKNRVQSILSSLIQLGVQGIPLDTQELIELYYDVYNPDTATHQRSLARDDFNVPVVSKGQGLANAPHLDTENQ